MNISKLTVGFPSFSLTHRVFLGSVVTGLGLWFASPALAHHAMGYQTPTTALAGFLSGLAHPVIGLDHLAFILAMGLVAAQSTQGLGLLVAFIVSALLGTGLHLAAFTLPGVELLISTSVLGIGLLLALQKSLSPSLSFGLFILAGLLHGYAYGEAIVGAGMSPLLAYLLGFSLVQMALALAVWGFVQKAFSGQGARGELRSKGLSAIGWLVCGAGLALLFPQIIGLLLTSRSS